MAASSDRLSTEVYSFVAYVAGNLCTLLWLIWVLVPDDVLIASGISYFPDKSWAIVIPMQIVGTLLFVVYTYICLNMLARCPLTSSNMMYDASTPQTTRMYGDPGEIPEIQDVKLTVINKVMFG
mmetsp:Transcript_44723/g.96144  ORF Transcript_44723/g.96144 Transcript_44723/m.96144 type:complete len:124 (-) Transcript_44723:378-749(-)|eukprot:CAMPEP_0206501676 /NCGR_PEP_ID=MMETSP0324_2-20121206/53469_1 /ASSEMBLY_ACC=CAM_ASM_000836 /TAXON_ID=2866 /ORGANISM="Crypthecodinium cohnii, Strain Seligo" /LENGTH=123 /DNA_ID=CAMNT_0053989575 /DNA_START=111 /DNA_END=482 /DNA_ORIENTATION=+